jgi:hypothetical protein
MATEKVAHKAKHGEKMIEVRVRFWTDHLSPKGTVRPKHARTSGVVYMERNKAHGIEPLKPKTFNSLLDLGKAIEQTLKKHGVVLHISRGMKRYVSPE